VAGRSRQNINATRERRWPATRFGPAQGELARTFRLTTADCKSLGTADRQTTIRGSQHDTGPAELPPISVTKRQQATMQATRRRYFDGSRQFAINGKKVLWHADNSTEALQDKNCLLQLPNLSLT